MRPSAAECAWIPLLIVVACVQSSWPPFALYCTSRSNGMLSTPLSGFGLQKGQPKLAPSATRMNSSGGWLSTYAGITLP